LRILRGESGEDVNDGSKLINGDVDGSAFMGEEE